MFLLHLQGTRAMTSPLRKMEATWVHRQDDKKVAPFCGKYSPSSEWLLLHARVLAPVTHKLDIL
jgi:hypothetical protein